MSWGTEDHKHNAYDVYGVADEHHGEPDLMALRRSPMSSRALIAGSLGDDPGQAT